MADKEVKDIDKPNHQGNSQRKPDIEWERLKIEKARLEIEGKRLELEKAKQHSTIKQISLQTGLPLLVSVIAFSLGAYSEHQRSLLDQQKATLEYNKAVSSYNEGRLELFRKRVDRLNSDDQIKSIYAEVFPRDSATLRNEQQATTGK